MKFSLIANPEKYSIKEPLETVIDWCSRNNSQLCISKELLALYPRLGEDGAVVLYPSESEAVRDSHIVIAVGGDGTMLHTAHLLKGIGLPVAGINTGKLGFMANIQPAQVTEALDCILRNEFKTDERFMLKAITKDALEYYALNEFLFSKKDASSLISLEVEYDGELINNYWADGLIISSPTGSTAYNLSAGGPIILPNTPVVVVTPINPHTLTTRPLVLPANRKIRVKSSNSQQILFSYDGIMLPYNNHLDIEIIQSDFTISLIQLPGQTYFETLRNKLMWGLDKRKP